MIENTKIILATRNRYLEYGMNFLLKKEEIIFARDFLYPRTDGIFLNTIQHG